MFSEPKQPRLLSPSPSQVNSFERSYMPPSTPLSLFPVQKKRLTQNLSKLPGQMKYIMKTGADSPIINPFIHVSKPTSDGKRIVFNEHLERTPHRDKTNGSSKPEEERKYYMSSFFRTIKKVEKSSMGSKAENIEPNKLHPAKADAKKINKSIKHLLTDPYVSKTFKLRKKPTAERSKSDSIYRSTTFATLDTEKSYYIPPGDGKSTIELFNEIKTMAKTYSLPTLV